jgi:PEGA domain
VTSDIPGVDVTIDGDSAGTTPMAAPITVDQGSRHVVGKREGYQDAAKDLTVNGGAPANVTLTMLKVVHEGRLTVTAGEHDAIALDGTVAAEQRFNGVIPSGGHTLRVTAPGMRSYQTELTINDGETRSLSVTLEAEVKPFPWWLVATGSGVLLAGAGVGGYFAFKTTNGQAPAGTAPPGTVQLMSLGRAQGGRH